MIKTITKYKDGTSYTFTHDSNTNGLVSAAWRYKRAIANGEELTATFGRAEITPSDLTAVNNTLSDRKESVATCQTIIRRLKKENVALQAMRDEKLANEGRELAVERAIEMVAEMDRMRFAAMDMICKGLHLTDLTPAQDRVLNDAANILGMLRPKVANEKLEAFRTLRQEETNQAAA